MEAYSRQRAKDSLLSRLKKVQYPMLFPEIMQIMIKMEIGTGDREKLQIPFRREKMRWHI